MNKNIIRKLRFKKALNNINYNCCSHCGNGICGFRDELSKREFDICGLCQNCQDEVFRE